MKRAVTEHFERRFGNGGRLVVSAGDVDVLAWKRERAGDCVLATVGMAVASQVVPLGSACVSREPRTELMMFAHEENVPCSAELLLNVAGYPTRNSTFLHWWHTIPLGGPLLEGSALTHLLLTFPPFDEAFATILSDQCRIDILWAVPITASERELAQRQGVDALEELLEAKGAVPTDLSRAAVTGR